MKSPVSWVGNKTPVLRVLYGMFPLEYERYIEPFGGSGAVLLGKEVPDRFEVLNDYNRNLVNLFRCMRDRPVEFIRALGFLNLNARDDFSVLKKFFRREEFDDAYFQQQLELSEVLLPPVQAQELRTLYAAAREDYDLRRAVMFLKLIRSSYASGGRSFACQPFNVRSLFGLIQAFSRRCENVIIENQDFETLIRHYDRPTSFFYCNPPYFTSEYVYDCGFAWDDHLRLHRVLTAAQGKFLLSYNDCPEIRALYAGHQFFDFKRAHSMAQRFEAGKEFPELLVANYDLRPTYTSQRHYAGCRRWKADVLRQKRSQPILAGISAANSQRAIQAVDFNKNIQDFWSNVKWEKSGKTDYLSGNDGESKTAFARAYEEAQRKKEAQQTKDTYSLDDENVRFSADEEPAAELEERPKKRKKTQPVAESLPIIAKRELKQNLLNLFSIPQGMRADIGGYVDHIADKIVKNGALTQEERDEFFDRMYSSGVMEVTADEYFEESVDNCPENRV